MMWTNESAQGLCLPETVLGEGAGPMLAFASCPKTTWHFDCSHLPGQGRLSFAGTVTRHLIPFNFSENRYYILKISLLPMYTFKVNEIYCCFAKRNILYIV